MITKLLIFNKYHYNLNEDANLPTSHKFSSFPPPKGLPISIKKRHKNL